MTSQNGISPADIQERASIYIGKGWTKAFARLAAASQDQDAQAALVRGVAAGLPTLIGRGWSKRIPAINAALADHPQLKTAISALSQTMIWGPAYLAPKQRYVRLRSKAGLVRRNPLTPSGRINIVLSNSESTIAVQTGNASYPSITEAVRNFVARDNVRGVAELISMTAQAVDTNAADPKLFGSAQRELAAIRVQLDKVKPGTRNFIVGRLSPSDRQALRLAV